MTVIVTRSAVEFWSQGKAPPELAAIVDGRVVTWNDVMRLRREHQQRQLAAKRCVVPLRACRIRVLYFDQFLMGGWQALIDDWRGPAFGAWIDRDRPHLMRPILEMFPLLPSSPNIARQWAEWKPVFAQRFARGMQDGRPRGVAHVWWNGHLDLRAMT